MAAPCESPVRAPRQVIVSLRWLAAARHEFIGHTRQFAGSGSQAIGAGHRSSRTNLQPTGHAVKVIGTDVQGADAVA